MASGLDIAGVAISAIELVVEFVFCYFVWREFKMTRKNFEWTKKDRREEKTKRELCYFAFIVLDNFANYYKNFIDKNDLIV